MALRARRKDSLSLIDELLPAEILKFIFQKLRYMDGVQLRAVSSYWKSLMEDLQISPKPCLMLPSMENIDPGNDNNNAYSCFLIFGESQVCNFKRIPKEFRESCCVGSSNGWLVFLEEHAVISLFHPFKQVKIELPSLLSNIFSGFKKLKRNRVGSYELKYFLGHMEMICVITKQQLRSYFARKVVLIGEPNNNNENFGVILLCKYAANIAYFKSGWKSWIKTPLNQNSSVYQDIIWRENHLYALKDGGTDIEIWGFQDHLLIKRDNIVLHFPEKSFDMRHLCTTRFYLIESCGDILFAIRFIEYVDLNGELVEHNVYPYQTCLFHVYKLDRNEKKWVEMKSLGDRMLFLGGNESVSASTQSFAQNCESNSIYYTDDNWEDDYLFGGHDMGIYNLKDGNIKSICEFSSHKILPSPCWIIPNLKPDACNPKMSNHQVEDCYHHLDHPKPQA